MKIFNTTKGILIEENNFFYQVREDWDRLINSNTVYEDILERIHSLQPLTESESEKSLNQLLPPLKSQEVWAAGVTYQRSKAARMDESGNAGGGDFYDRVYHAERPELFYKSAPYRVSGPGQKVRIRKDSKWNVPEPELTLMISSSGRIVGYTIGNDMSSRDIEGENPLYLPQAKTYDKSAALGPCIYISNSTLPEDTRIELEIVRTGKVVFAGAVTIDQMKRKFTGLAEYLFREMTFTHGCLLMTGTGIVPGNDFTLMRDDKIIISIEPIGTLINFVE